jgi:hypothetical protein
MCALGIYVGIALFIRGFKLLQRRRLILDTPSSKIRSASMGMVEVNGLAVGPYTMVAPITARPCYYYRTLVWEWKQQGKNKRWVKVAGECMHVPFFVDDNTGRMLVDPRGADLDLHRDFQEEFNGSFFSGSDNAPVNVTGFLARHSIATSNRIKVEEYCIKPKNALFILGTLAENQGLEVAPRALEDHEVFNGARGMSSGSFSVTINSGNSDSQFLGERFASRSGTEHSEVIRLTSASSPGKVLDMTQQQKIAAALLKAGISNPAAWSAGGVSVAGVANPGVQVVEDNSTSSESNDLPNADPSLATKVNGFDPHPPVVLMKGANNKAFLISWRSQKEVARTMGWQCTLMIWVGPALALGCLALFLNSVHLL